MPGNDKNSLTIKAHNIDFAYDNKEKVLDNLSFEFNSQHINFIIGRNGIGKTTVTKIIAGLLKPAAGRLVLNGTDLFSLYENNKIKCSYLPTNPGKLFIGMTIHEEIKICRSYFGSEAELIKDDVDFYLSQNDRILSTFSNGEKYKAALLSALWSAPDILILDEPFILLDYKNRIEQIKKILLLKKMQKMIIIWVTHRIEETLLSKNNILLLD